MPCGTQDGNPILERRCGKRYVTTMDTNVEVTREMPLKDAKAQLSAVVNAAIAGTSSVITRHGKPAAVVVGYEEWKRLSAIPSFARLLMACPVDEADWPERDRTPMRDADL